jgi:hypothetical protein
MFPDITEQYRNFVPWLAADGMRLFAAPVVVAFVPAAFVWLLAMLRTRDWSFAGRSEHQPAAVSGD